MANMEHMKSKYEALGRVDNEAIDKKVDDMFMECFLDDKARFTEILLDAMEKGKTENE